MALQEGNLVHHDEHGNGIITQVFKFTQNTWPNERRSRFPYLVQFESGFAEQFRLGELKKGYKPPPIADEFSEADLKNFEGLVD